MNLIKIICSSLLSTCPLQSPSQTKPTVVPEQANPPLRRTQTNAAETGAERQLAGQNMAPPSMGHRGTSPPHRLRAKCTVNGQGYLVPHNPGQVPRSPGERSRGVSQQHGYTMPRTEHRSQPPGRGKSQKGPPDPGRMGGSTRRSGASAASL